jgi:hypothetical protein
LDRLCGAGGRSHDDGVASSPATGTVDLYWLPMGARGHSLALGGRLSKGIAARLARREPLTIYHSVLEVKRLTADLRLARRVLANAPLVPTPAWGATTSA